MNDLSAPKIRRRLSGLALVMSLGGFLAMNGCEGEAAGYGCYSDDDCPDDLSCLESEQGAVCFDGFCGCDYKQGICTQSCSSDDDCPYDLVCNKASTCGGAADLCGRP